MRMGENIDIKGVLKAVERRMEKASSQDNPSW
jgi:hypothetical protein